MDAGSDASVEATTERVWEGAGVAADAFRVRPDRRDARSDTRCVSLPVEDRWFVLGGGRLGPGVRSQAELLEAIEAHLRDEGYTIERFRDPNTPGRALRAVSGEGAVVVTVEGDGAAVLEVYAGPCATPFATLAPSRFVPA